jgi:HSP20 family protein
LTQVKDAPTVHCDDCPCQFLRQAEEVAMVESTHKSGLFPSLMDPLRSMSARVADWFAPASEAAVNGSEYRIALELPGVAEADIEITVHDGVVERLGQENLGTRGKG